MALEFKGLLEYINCGNAASLSVTDNFTIVARVYWPADATLRQVVEKSNIVAGSYEGWDIIQMLDNKCRFEVLWAPGNVDNILSNAALDAGEHLIVIVRDSGTSKMYIDNVLQAATMVSTPDVTANDFLIGMNYTTVSWPWYNCIYEIRLYARVLSAAEIAIIYYSKGADNLVKDLRGRWLMNEASDGFGGCRDSHGTNHGLGSSVPIKMFSTGKISYAVDFTPNAYIDCGKANSLKLDGNSFSFSFWAAPDALSADYMIGKGETEAQDNSLIIGFRDANTFTFAFWADDLDSDNFNFVLETYYHFVVTYNTATNQRYIYINAVDKGDDIAAGDLTNTDNFNLLLGVAKFAGGHYYDGKLDEVGFWNAVLTQAQVTALYNAGNGLAYDSFPGSLKTNLVSYWTLDGIKAIDISGNGNHGTPFGDPVYRAGPMRLVRPVIGKE